MSASVFNILVGSLMLLLGRRLFWLFVGGAGFVAGITVATYFFDQQPEWLVLVAAIGLGVLGALLAVFLQRFAIMVGGFIAGGYAALSVHQTLALAGEPWMFFLGGAVLGLVLMLFLFDWALILLSSLAGAGLVAQSVALEETVQLLVFGACFLFGLAVQASMKSGGRREK